MNAETNGPLAAILLAAALLLSGPAAAGEADVATATAEKRGDSWTFAVAVRHADSGWEHYADRWDVLAPDGAVLASRTLFHPHVGEQPFTRELSGVRIPAGVTRVTIRAHDNVHRLGGREFALDLASAKGN